jgi:hypothetical protein
VNPGSGSQTTLPVRFGNRSRRCGHDKSQASQEGSGIASQVFAGKDVSRVALAGGRAVDHAALGAVFLRAGVGIAGSHHLADAVDFDGARITQAKSLSVLVFAAGAAFLRAGVGSARIRGIVGVVCVFIFFVIAGGKRKNKKNRGKREPSRSVCSLPSPRNRYRVSQN